MITSLRPVPPEVLHDCAFALAELDDTRSFDDFAARLMTHLARLQSLDAATRPAGLAAALVHGLRGAELFDQLALLRARLVVRRELLHDQVDVQALHSALREAEDVPTRLLLGRADGPAARNMLWRATDDPALAIDAGRYMRSGSTRVVKGQLETCVRRKAGGLLFLALVLLAWLVHFGLNIPWLQGDPSAGLAYLIMTPLVVALLLAPLVRDFAREIEVRDAVNSKPPVRMV